MDKPRTTQQNKAMHLMFQMLADKLNDGGLDMRLVLKPEIDIPWSKDTIKDYMWRPVQEAYLNKHSTTELTTKDIDKIFDIINKHLGEKFFVTVDFPSIEHLIHNNT